MSPTLEQAAKRLHEEGATCVAARGGRFLVARERGLRPLLRWLDADPDALRGASVADKVVGKAAALLMAYGGIKELHAGVLSAHAAVCLTALGVPFSCDRQVPYIINRQGDGMCPMEARSLAMETPGEAYEEFIGLLKKA